MTIKYDFRYRVANLLWEIPRDLWLCLEEDEIGEGKELNGDLMPQTIPSKVAISSRRTGDKF